jgi:hypothetical protein
MAQSHDRGHVARFETEKFKREGERLRARENAIVAKIEALLCAYERMTSGEPRFSELPSPMGRRAASVSAIERAAQRWALK